MPFGLGGVGGLFQAAEHPVVNGVLFGLPGRFEQDPLELEPALRVLDIQTEAPGELGERLELGGLGISVGPPEKARVFLGQERGDRLVGREHEVFDDLMAFVVHGEMGTHDFPLVAQVDFDGRHVQLGRPTLEPAAAEDLGELEHGAEHSGHLGRNPFMVGLGGLHDGDRLLVGEPVVDVDRGPGEFQVGADPFGVELHKRG